MFAYTTFSYVHPRPIPSSTLAGCAQHPESITLCLQLGIPRTHIRNSHLLPIGCYITYRCSEVVSLVFGSHLSVLEISLRIFTTLLGSLLVRISPLRKNKSPPARPGASRIVYRAHQRAPIFVQVHGRTSCRGFILIPDFGNSSCPCRPLARRMPQGP